MSVSLEHTRPQRMNARDDLAHQRAFFEACAERDGTAAARLAQVLLEWTVERVGPLLTKRELQAAGAVS